eukprot:6200477-Pleurochrysis_carterae.AAC.1
MRANARRRLRSNILCHHAANFSTSSRIDRAGTGMLMRRWDFVAAYLQGKLQDGEVVYCYAPPGYSTTGADGKPRICRVEKPVYGMAQAGRRWQRTLFPWLTDY